jgi:hypothetical protein
MKKTICLVVLVLAVLVTPALAENVPAQPVIKITDYNTFSVAKVLDENIGKEVEVTVSSGATFKGKLVGVGAKAIHLAKLSGRDFYDAAIEKGSIVAVVLRARDK